MSSRMTIAVHAVVAALFFFFLQVYVMGETLTISLVWAGAGAVGAGWLASAQARRGL